MTNAAAISRALREGGLRPLPSGTSRMREGIRVRKGWGGEVYISFDLDSLYKARALRSAADEILKERGYTTRTSDGYYGDVLSLRVKRGEDT